MAYLHSAFIENTQEAREWLESLGYKPVLITDAEECIYTRGLENGWCFFTGDFSFYFIPENSIDCRGNLSLFKAITALRDDSDYMQWFTDGYHWEHCPDKSADVEAWRTRYTPLGEKDSIPHKATLEELIEHFKTETI